MQSLANTKQNLQDAGYRRKLLVFVTGAIFSLVTLIFCFTKLFVLASGEDRTVYIGIITTIIGVWIPQPRISSTNKPNDSEKANREKSSKAKHRSEADRVEPLVEPINEQQDIELKNIAIDPIYNNIPDNTNEQPSTAHKKNLSSAQTVKAMMNNEVVKELKRTLTQDKINIDKAVDNIQTKVGADQSLISEFKDLKKQLDESLSKIDKRISEMYVKLPEQKIVV